MKKVILHIGRHKTGTTAVQRFLFQQPALLESHDYDYPHTGIRGFGHHELGSPLTRARLRQEDRDIGSLISGLRDSLMQDIGAKQTVSVISSESFQLCEPEVVRELLRDCSVDVIVYLREQVKYLLSAYAQKVHATNFTGSIEDFFAVAFNKNYATFLAEWEAFFPGRVKVRIYDRDELIERNIVVDFCRSVLSIPAAALKVFDFGDDANPSLTRDLLAYKIALNQHESLPEPYGRMLYEGLAELSRTDGSGAVAVSTSLINTIQQRFEGPNREVARKYFAREALFRPYQPVPMARSEQSGVTHFPTIRQKLIELHPALAESLPLVS